MKEKVPFCYTKFNPFKTQNYSKLTQASNNKGSKIHKNKNGKTIKRKTISQSCRKLYCTSLSNLLNRLKSVTIEYEQHNQEA